MGENGGCLQSCQKCCFKRFKSVHTQATVLQSCQSKLLTLNLFKRCETKQLGTDFIDNLRVMFQGHVYIITPYRLLYDVITYPCHDKMYMQLTRSLYVLAWRWVERHFPIIFTHQGFKTSYVSEETFRKNWCRANCQTFKLPTELGHSYY